MKKVIIKYGLIACAVFAIMMPLIAWRDEVVRSSYAALIGYSIMILAFSTIFLAVARYDQSLSDKKVNFGKAFLIGLGISLMATFTYVIAWCLIDGFTGGDFIETYADQAIADLREEGASPEEIAETEAVMNSYKKWYANPWSKMLITSSEIFPVGVLVSLITALIFQFKKR